ncbi:class I SAM-dependent methyltransferase [Acidobacteria bacterium AB60]|nr:class I SAM-dependent methyltransferase [Acidobacteria bacterium AB60]
MHWRVEDQGAHMSYTFGDNQEASRRLRRLAEIYEPETRDLLSWVRSMRSSRIQAAIDLGCGPGWSTQLVAEILAPERTLGIDASPRYIAEARANHPGLEFVEHDVLKTPFPIEGAECFLCRFLLTHLESPRAALEAWAQAAAPGALLAIHETERISSPHPALGRYYEMVEQMQRHFGQELQVGAALDNAFAGTDWRVRHSESLALHKAAREMAQLHLANLRIWGANDFAKEAFDRTEIQHLERELGRIAGGEQEGGVVCNVARQVIAERR